MEELEKHQNALKRKLYQLTPSSSASSKLVDDESIIITKIKLNEFEEPSENKITRKYSLVSPQIKNGVLDDYFRSSSPLKKSIKNSALIENIKPLAVHIKEENEQIPESKDDQIDIMIKEIKQTFPVKQIKLTWSDQLIAKTTHMLQNMSISQVYEQYSGKIPMRTLSFWKKNPKTKSFKNRRGCKTKLKFL